MVCIAIKKKKKKKKSSSSLFEQSGNVDLVVNITWCVLPLKKKKKKKKAVQVCLSSLRCRSSGKCHMVCIAI